MEVSPPIRAESSLSQTDIRFLHCSFIPTPFGFPYGQRSTLDKNVEAEPNIFTKQYQTKNLF